MAGAAAVLAAAEGVPPYRSWTHLRCNERAAQTGLQQFYLDETGARVPPPPSLAAGWPSETSFERKSGEPPQCSKLDGLDSGRRHHL